MKLTNKTYWAIAAAFLVFYYVIVCKQVLNIPRADDYEILFGWLLDYLHASSAREKIALLFEAHAGDHRMVPMRLITLVSYLLTGKISITAVIIAGNLMWVALAPMFCYLLNRTDKKDLPLGFFLIVLLMFNGHNLETCTWATSSVVNINSLFLGMAAILLICKKNSLLHFSAGVFVAVVTVFSYGSGMCILPALAIVLLLQNRKREFIVFLQ